MGAKVNIKTTINNIPDNLPNGRVNQPYRTHIANGCLPVGNSAICWFDGLEDLGLHFIPDKKQITGVPTTSGKFEISLNVRDFDGHGKELLSIRNFNILIEDDYVIPFEDAPLDEADPDWKPDEDSVVITLSGSKKSRTKNMIAASKRGRLHIQTGKFREDDFKIKYDDEDNWYLLAVADGSGKAEYSRKGSKIACEAAIASCAGHLAAQSVRLDVLANKFTGKKQRPVCNEMIRTLHEVIASSVVAASQEITSEAERCGRRPGDYATTLLLCICKRYGFGWLIGAFWVGDGAICVYNKDRWYANILNVPDGGELSPPARFLTTPGIVEPAELAQRICFTVIDNFSALFLMTNGISDPVFGTETDMQSFELWNKFWKDLSSEIDFDGRSKNLGEKLLKWLDFWAPGKHDDRTIAILY